MARRHLQGCSPCLCRLRTDRLATASKYWTYRSHDSVYGPSKSSSLPSTEGGFTSTVQWLAQERNWVRTRGSVSHRAVDCVRSSFSREQWLCPSLLMIVRGVAICEPHEIRMVLDHTRTEHGKHVTCWSGFLLQGVHWFESLRLSDMSNRLFVAVIT
jgi:hypothetical protein